MGKLLILLPTNSATMNSREEIKFLYNRAGFGAGIREWEQAENKQQLIERLLAAHTPQPLEVVTQEEWVQNSPKAIKALSMTADERKMRQKSFREKTGELNLLWLATMVQTDHPLQEKMALFWHGHFATRIDNPYFDQLLLQELRTHALGNFGDLLRAVSKSPAMLQFLNNQQNRKLHPNENFAREVMELFTLGRGHYTETDIKEAARAFTGWSYDEQGEFIFREKQHDDGAKTVLGKTGRFNGDDVLSLLLEQKQTALFVTQKIYRYFVNEEKQDTTRVQQLAGLFYKSGYDINALMREILSAAWFCKPENTAAHVKSPVELLAGMQRTIPMDFKNDRTLINLQRVLGQQLFYPPNVAGWPGGRAWIDASSLVIRMRLPEAFFASRELDLRAKEQDAEMAEFNKKTMDKDAANEGRFRVGAVIAEWDGYLSYWNHYKDAELPQLLSDYLLPMKLSKQRLDTVTRFADRSNRDNYVKSLTILLMSLPEYQLC